MHFVVILALVLGSLQPARAELNEHLYRKVAASTALIYKSEGPFTNGSGTAFLIDAQERLLLTARHVVENTDGGLASAVTVIFAQTRDGEIITDLGYYRKNWQAAALRGKVVYDSVRRDMAVIQVEKLPAGIKALELAARSARPGQAIHVIGNSGERFGGVFNYCHGYVRNVFHWESMGATVLVTQAPTNRGDSGGPTVNDKGQVVGFASMSTTGESLPRENLFRDLQVTGLSVCVSEIRSGLEEMRAQRLAGTRSPPALVLKGEARPAVHFVTLQKDVLYRLEVKAKGFVPDVRIDDIIITPVSQGGRPPGSEWQHLFTPRETKEYRIQVNYYPGQAVGKGSFPYTLAIDQVTFAAEKVDKEARLPLNEQHRKLEAGKVYQITVRGKGFEPDVQILDGTKSAFTQLNNGRHANSADGTQQFLEAVGVLQSTFETSFMFVPGRTTDYRILVSVSPFSLSGTDARTYALQITEAKALVSVSDRLTAGDPLYPQSGPYKKHAAKLEAGKNYQIDLLTTAFDSRLLLEDAAGKVIMQGFDAEGYNGRLFFRPTRTDTYRVVATTRQIDASGPYRLTVVEVPGVQVRR